MDFIEERFNEIVQLLLHAENDCENSRQIFAQIRGNLILIQERHDQLLNDFRDLEEANRRINQLNANELRRQAEELEELRIFYRNLQQNLENINNELRDRQIRNENFIRNSVLANMGALRQRLINYQENVRNLIGELNNRNNRQIQIRNEILALNDEFNMHVNDIRTRRNNLIGLENDRTNFFINQQNYITDYENFLENKIRFVLRQEDNLRNLENDLYNHAQIVETKMIQNVDNFKNSKNSYMNLSKTELDNCNSIIRKSESIIQTIDNYFQSNSFDFYDSFSVNFLFILLAGFILYLFVFNVFCIFRKLF